MWTLILVFTIARGAEGTSVATSAIPGFSSRETCFEAGKAIPDLKRFLCIEVK